MSLRSARFAEVLAAGVVVLLGVWTLWQAMELRQGPGYAAVGPRIFPMVVGVGFLVAGAALLLGGLRRGDPALAPAPPPASLAKPTATSADDALDEDPSAAPTDWPTLAGVAALLAGYVALFLPLGFIISSALLLVGGARVLGSRSPIRDIAAGVLVSLAAYLVFTRLLGLELPPGPLDFS
ncbi:MAG: tripartite tricarboxylate transporter TctB family protein [Chloroflexi bacterium]|nr:tripartite tricarboxylate transporter TctB family protein [Chloroflexota bacterium]